MSMFDITPAGAFVNAIESSGKNDSHKRYPSQPVEKPRKPKLRAFLTALVGMFGF